MELSKLFSDIIETEDIHTLFQPIVSLKTGEILGYEALSRGPIGSLHSPIALIEMAQKEEKLWELETIFRKSAIKQASTLGIKSLLFMNVEPNIIHDPKFKEGFTKNYVSEYLLNPEQIIFEITERSAISNYEGFKSTIDHYKNQGYQIAIDDTGAGYSNLSVLSKIKPYYIKIDMEIIRDIHKDTFKQAIVNSFVILSNLTNTRLIAEGIETCEELKTLIQLGVHSGQGFYIGKPSIALVDVCPKVKYEIVNSNYSDSLLNMNTEISIGEISEAIPTFDASIKCATVKDFFENNNVEGTCIVEREQVVGLVMKNHINAILSGQYGYSLYAKRPVSKIMDDSCLTVDYFTPINVVAELAMARAKDKVYDNIIVTKGFKYWGIVSVIKLLRQFLEMEKKMALELNPLTGLPGNTLINKALEKIIHSQKQVSVLYIDLDNFKVYNDLYGFEKGDHVINMTKELIVTNTKTDPSRSCFIGHIGGDDFIAIIECSMDESIEICNNIISYFDKRILEKYADNDIERGYIYGKDRDDTLKQFPLTSISIAGINGTLDSFHSPLELAEYMSKIKKKVKSIEKSCYIIEPAPPSISA